MTIYQGPSQMDLLLNVVHVHYIMTIDEQAILDKFAS